MCIIAAKPAGVEMPSDDTLFAMWSHNSDGAGFMYANNGKVYIEKGFMEYKALVKALDKLGEKNNLKDLPIVMHFRITTHGGTKPENTHPFAITDDEKSLGKPRFNAPIAVAHNGIINSVSPRKGVSDTMEYIMTQLYPLYKGCPTFYKNKYLMEMVENAIESKMAFLIGSGEIYTIGNFVEDGGIKYSNSTYKPWSSAYSCGYNGKWGSIYDYSSFGSTYFDEYEEDYTYYSYEHKELMYLWDLDDDVFVINMKDGMFDEGSDYCVDDEGNVYTYNYNTKAMELLPDLCALDKNNRYIKLTDDYRKKLDKFAICEEVVYDPRVKPESEEDRKLLIGHSDK